jgi:hypothetical protein
VRALEVVGQHIDDGLLVVNDKDLCGHSFALILSKTRAPVKRARDRGMTRAG